MFPGGWRGAAARRTNMPQQQEVPLHSWCQDLQGGSASFLFPQHTLKLQTCQPPAQQMLHSANRNSMPQRVSQASFRLMLVKKLPHSYPFQGKNSGNSSHRLSLPWDALCRIQSSAPHSTYSKGTGTEQPGVLDHLQSITAQIFLYWRI